jgi:DNA-binding winged helix-turn-helix (wHTH) protein/tetratricopeptide (TPR) repeat protein
MSEATIIPQWVGQSPLNRLEFLRTRRDKVIQYVGMAPTEKVSYEFGPFQMDPSKRLLTSHDEPLPLTPKAFDILLVLVERAGEVLEKEELLKLVWPDTVVEEGNLTFNIHALRKALGERPSEHKYILTIPGRGYCFVADTRKVPAATIDDSGSAAVPPRLKNPPLTSLAVLPFKSPGHGPEDEYLGLGIADALITRLSGLRQVVVRPTISVRKYAVMDGSPDVIGRELAVESILEGSIRRSGDRIRVTVQLISVRDGSELWAEKFDERFTDVFAVEDRVSARVAEALKIRLTGPEIDLLRKRYTVNADAFQAYLKGRYYWNKRTRDGIKKGIEHFDNAIEQDPLYALAYAGLADCYSLLSMHGVLEPREAFTRAKAAAVRALEIDDQLAEAHASLAYASLYYEWDWAGAEREFKRSIDLNPNYATAHHWYHEYLVLRGRIVEATEEIRKAQELDPLSPAINAALVLPLLNSGQYERGVYGLKRVIELEPGFYRSHLFLGIAYVLMRQYEMAFKELNEALSLSENSTRAVAALGWAYAVAGRRDEARAMMDELERRMQERYVPPYSMAIIYTALGEKDRAFEWLERGFEARDEFMTRLGIAIELNSLRSDPRFGDLADRVGLSTSTHSADQYAPH